MALSCVPVAMPLPWASAPQPTPTAIPVQVNGVAWSYIVTARGNQAEMETFLGLHSGTLQEYALPDYGMLVIWLHYTARADIALDSHEFVVATDQAEAEREAVERNHVHYRQGHFFADVPNGSLLSQIDLRANTQGNLMIFFTPPCEDGSLNIYYQGVLLHSVEHDDTTWC